MGQVTTPPLTITVYAEPTLTIAADKTSVYVGDVVTFSGQYLNASGGGVPGVEVTLYENGSVIGTSTTGGNGDWSVQWTPLGAGSYGFYAEAPLVPP